MRIKTLVLSAMFGAATVVSSSAADGNVYSVNVVGYINLSLTNQYSLIGNQLNDGAGNLVTNIFRAPFTAYPVTIYKFNGVDYDRLRREGESMEDWVAIPGNGDPAGTRTWQMTMGMGEAVFVRNQGAGLPPINITLVGEVRQTGRDNLTKKVRSGYDLYSAQVPQEGGLVTVHQYTPVTGDRFFGGFDGVDYTNRSNYDGTEWTGDPADGPIVKVGEGFWIKSNAAAEKDWTRVFNVN